MHFTLDPAIAQNTWLLAAIWMGLAATGAIMSIRLKISAALVEIVLGIIAGNLISLHANRGSISSQVSAASC